jgi:hypothetical protein
MGKGGTVDRAAAIPEIIRRLHKMEPGETLELLTWKRDHSLRLLKQSADAFVFYEQGFVNGRYQVGTAKLKKVLKSLLKREFPRSNKIRIRCLKGTCAPMN